MADPIRLGLLAAVALTSAWGLYELARDNTRIPNPGADGTTEAISIQLPENEPASLGEFSAVVTRPLFFPDRKLPRPEQSAEPTPSNAQVGRSNPPPELRLTAIAIEAEQAIALADGANGEAQKIREGESISGWTVARIEDDAVVLSNGERDHRVELRQFEQPPGAAAAPLQRVQPRANIQPRRAANRRPPVLPRHSRSPNPAGD